MIIRKRKKDQKFNLLVLKMYNKLNYMILLKLCDEQAAKSVVYDVFDQVYSLDFNKIPLKELESHTYKIAAEKIKERATAERGRKK